MCRLRSASDGGSHGILQSPRRVSQCVHKTQVRCGLSPASSQVPWCFIDTTTCLPGAYACFHNAQTQGLWCAPLRVNSSRADACTHLGQIGIKPDKGYMSDERQGRHVRLMVHRRRQQIQREYMYDDAGKYVLTSQAWGYRATRCLFRGPCDAYGTNRTSDTIRAWDCDVGGEP